MPRRGGRLWRSAGRRSAAARAPVAIVERGARRVGLFSSMTAAGVAARRRSLALLGTRSNPRGRATADRSTGRGDRRRQGRLLSSGARLNGERSPGRRRHRPGPRRLRNRRCGVECLERCVGRAGPATRVFAVDSQRRQRRRHARPLLLDEGGLLRSAPCGRPARCRRHTKARVDAVRERPQAPSERRARRGEARRSGRRRALERRARDGADRPADEPRRRGPQSRCGRRAITG